MIQYVMIEPRLTALYLKNIAAKWLTNNIGVSLSSQSDPIRLATPAPPSRQNTANSGQKKQDEDGLNAKLMARNTWYKTRQQRHIHLVWIGEAIAANISLLPLTISIPQVSSQAKMILFQQRTSNYPSQLILSWQMTLNISFSTTTWQWVNCPWSS